MSEELLNHPHAKTIWDKLMSHFNNKYGVAALMGNLQAESGLYPDRVQGDVPYSTYSMDYTADVDSGYIAEYDFVHNGPNGGGYGLAQWTYYTRKQGLYSKWKTGGYHSIGSVDLACDFLCEELSSDYKTVYNAIKNATNIKTPSDAVLHDFERPADQSESVENLRASMGEEIYSTFSGSSPSTPSDPDNPTIPTKRKGMPKLLLYAIATDI